MARRARNAGGELLEAHFQQQVEQLAAFYGWLLYHTHDSRRSAPGFPDLVLVRGPQILFVELKRDRGRLTPEQCEWLEALELVAVNVRAAVVAAPIAGLVPPAVEVHVWRPSDFDELHARLARGRVRHEPLGV